ncbi:MAG: GNAT family N-acetyltransferase [Phycisphaerales bacterium]|jgi:ribosomal protein S18 acetylase RimI-like enzyme|nr:GNAT family N-acetyltransferase [Phycisphaerales bacterium]
MILDKNTHIEAATALLKSKSLGEALIQNLQSKPNNDYFFVTSSQSNIKHSLLIVKNAGATATFIATEPSKNTEIDEISKLITEGVQILDGGNTSVAQTIMKNSNTKLARAFSKAGFSTLATLVYLESKIPNKRGLTYSDNIDFVSMENRSDKALGSILNQTYENSLDCPKIHGLRSVDDIIVGHRTAGNYNPKLWTIAELDNRHAGILLLNPLSDSTSVELAYIGVAPWARNHGVADALVDYCFYLGSDYGFSEVTLAVDANNRPALNLYKKWNFRKSTTRLTMIQKLSTLC